MKTTTIAAALILAGQVASAGGHGTAPAQTGKLGDEVYLMDANKMTLYTFEKDANGVSNCYDECAEAWPPLVVEAGTRLPQNYSLTERKDGTMQVQYKGQPLYLWVNDAKPGDMTGDGVMDVWNIARP